MIYLESDSSDANFNFALESYAMDELNIGDCYFMFWRTNPTLMAGRYQNILAEINMPFAKENNIHIVRRITGGGTIYTDLNGWQFSFIVKTEGEKQINFGRFTKPVITALQRLGVPAQAGGRNDLLIEGRKFSGNAQYVRKDLTLHHGSLLFDTNLENLVRALTPDDEKLVSKGIKSVRQRVTNIAEYLDTKITSEEFRDLMLEYLLKDTETYRLNSHDLQRVKEISRDKFDSWEWNFGGNPKFNISKENRFPGGKLRTDSLVKDGRIEHISFSGDFFANKEPAALETALTGCLYEENAVRKALTENDADSVFMNINLEQVLSCIV